MKKLSSEKFNIPPSLKGKVFRAGEFFKKKAENSSQADFLVENLSHTERIKDGDAAYIHRKVKIPLEAGRSEDGYVFPDRTVFPTPDSSLLKILSGEEEWDAASLSGIIFIDTETTGLAGGTGTYPFLCGAGYFEEKAFVVEQFFMEDFPHEPLMLDRMGKKLREAEALASYNGKTFDVPLLKTRYIYNRIRVNLEIPHIDLLHPSRRIWRGVLSDCRLETVEKEFFHLYREKDVDSSLIPQIYFHFIRGRHLDWMLPVFHHNVQDIVTLGALLLFFCRIMSDPEKSDLKHPLELWGLGKMFLKSGDVDKALKTLEQALYLSREADLAEMMLFHIGRLYKKIGRWEEALDTWRSLVKSSARHRINSAVEMAKYYEHRKKEPHTAREILLQALGGLEMAAELESYLDGIKESPVNELTPELEHRLRRLEKKIKKQQG